MTHTEKTQFAAQKIIDKIIDSDSPIGVVVTKDGFLCRTAETAQFQKVARLNPHIVVGIYDCNVNMKDLMDDLAFSGIK